MNFLLSFLRYMTCPQTCFSTCYYATVKFRNQRPSLLSDLQPFPTRLEDRSFQGLLQVAKTCSPCGRSTLTNINFAQYIERNKGSTLFKRVYVTPNRAPYCLCCKGDLKQISHHFSSACCICISIVSNNNSNCV